MKKVLSLLAILLLFTILELIKINNKFLKLSNALLYYYG